MSSLQIAHTCHLLCIYHTQPHVQYTHFNTLQITVEVNKNIRGYIICTARAHKTLQLAASHKQKSTNKNNHRTEQLVTIYEHLSYSNITVYKPTRFSKNFNVTYLNTSSLTSVYHTVLFSLSIAQDQKYKCTTCQTQQFFARIASLWQLN